MGLEGRVAVVTGSSVGIGKAAALALAEAGARVVVNARAAERAEPVAEQLRDAGGDALAVAADVATADGVETLFERTLDRYGTVDILVNNAGTTLIAPSEELPLADWQRILDLNLTGPFLCSQAAGPPQLPKGRGVVIHTEAGRGRSMLPARLVKKNRSVSPRWLRVR
jgi:NAD(P)-dependent dehydrogenase (short-subunit alcohol dehydrogenase family)